MCWNPPKTTCSRSNGSVAKRTPPGIAAVLLAACSKPSLTCSLVTPGPISSNANEALGREFRSRAVSPVHQASS